MRYATVIEIYYQSDGGDHGLHWVLEVDGKLVAMFFTERDAYIWKEAVAPTGGV